MIRVYDHVEGDVPRIAVLPAWNEVNFFDGRKWLNDAAVDSDTLRSYQQILNLYDGTIHTSYRWENGEQAASVSIDAFVSRSNPHLAVVKFEVTPHFSGPVRVSLPIRPWKAPIRVPVARLESLEPDASGQTPNVRYPGHMAVRDWQVESSSVGGLLRVVSQAEGGTTAVGQVVALSWPPDLKNLTVIGSTSDEIVSIELGFQASAETSYTFLKYVGAVSSLDRSIPAEAAAEVAQAARARGYDALFEEHARAWHELWQTDIVVDDPVLQKVIHSTMFYLLGSVREGTEFNIPPMGLSSAGYSGHIFWDSDTFMFPAVLALHPEMAKSLVMFRYRTLEAAKINARLNGYKGAMYPWEADELGQETTPRFAWQNALQENHVTGDVVVAQWQYYLATGDKNWLAQYGYPIMAETADYWVSRAIYNAEKGRYEIRKVVSPDEGSRGVDNDGVTNAGAQRNLEIAIAASKLLGKPVNPDWEKLIGKIYIPYDAEKQFHPEFEGAPPWKEGIGHVVPLLGYPLELPMSEQAKRNDLENARQSIMWQHGGAYLLPTIYPIVAAELGDRNLVDDFLVGSYEPYMKPPFNVLNEGTSGESVVFLTGTGFLQQFIYGYTGLRWGENGIAQKFKPFLPSRVKKLVLKNISTRGKRYDFVVEGETLSQVSKDGLQ
jgi:trehalose/maltose hydrolase-like predicted phosphorylase